ncbi:jg8536 [Pararge aegeria aegeria]|uniref:Jg8536 protein n=1 Tax=Pararge aegeria aegeria TaxID=348720 RepID=A0A8S4RJM4_9NEOP|nr:jg8536 [Pararge aegeria aegeria]
MSVLGRMNDGEYATGLATATHQAQYEHNVDVSSGQKVQLRQKIKVETWRRNDPTRKKRVIDKEQQLYD